MRQMNRRHMLKLASTYGMAAAASTFWRNPAVAAALSAASPSSDFKAVVLVTLTGGNDGNNMLVPLDTHQYASYASIRGNIALSQNSLTPLSSPSQGQYYGMHSALKNVASLFESGRALVVGNVGPISRPATKADILANRDQFPCAGFSHPDGIAEWESAQVGTSVQTGVTGWGGRMAEYLVGQSGVIPPVLSGANSTFDVGKSVQAVAIQNGSSFSALPPQLNTAVAAIAQAEGASANLLTQHVAHDRAVAMADQQVLDQAAAYIQLQTQFGKSQLSQGFKNVAQILAGRSVTGAARQIFYLRHNGYDSHTNQLNVQNSLFTDFDQSIGSFFNALAEIGLQDKVMVLTHSDFGRTLQPNSTGGTDHAWGNHHLILGGGISGRRIVGTIPDMTLGTSQDLGGTGEWIPTQSVVQMVAGVGSWMGLSNAQVANVFPDLANFPSGPITLF